MTSNEDENNQQLQPVVEHPVEDVLSDITHETHFGFNPKTESGKKFKEDFPKWFQRNYRYIFVLILILTVSIYSFVKIQDLNNTIKKLNDDTISLTNKKDELRDYSKKKDIQIKTLKDKIVDNSFVIVNKETLLNDIHNRFSQISPKVSKVIVSTIIEESKKYNINPVILYSLGIVESSHRYWIEHAQVTLNVYDKKTKKKNKVTTKAVGWGGVVWEWHDKLLKEKGIANTRSDLFYPDVNIKATAAIYNMFYNMDLKKGVTNRDVSAQRRYFGGNYKSYSDKIHKQIMEVMKTEIYRVETDEENVK